MARLLHHLPTLLIGFVLGAIAMYGMFVVAKNRVPPTPMLQPPIAIEVTLHSSSMIGAIDTEQVKIPPDKLGFAFRLLTPETYFEGGVHDFITPIVAEAVITHADGEETSVLVRDHGKNPAVVTVDGRTYFYARNDSDVHTGAMQLIELVCEVANKKRVSK